MRRLLWAASFAFLLIGCDGAQPPTTPPASSPVQRQPLRVVGRVADSADNPVAGAEVTQWDTANTAISDSGGAFDLTATIGPEDRSIWVTVRKAGFETSELNRSVDTASNTSLRLHQIRSVNAGESFQAVVGRGDSSCGYHWGYVCRRVRVIPESSGMLTLQVISDTPAALGIPIGPVGFPQSLERRISTPVRAGVEVLVEIAADWQIVAPAESR